MEKKKLSLISFIFLIVILLLCIYTGVSDFSDRNTKIHVSCNKNTNLCTIRENKLIFSDRKIIFPISLIKSTETNLIGCGRYGGDCRYSLRIHLGNGNSITSYYNFKKYSVDKVRNYFEEFLKDKKIDKLSIEPSKNEKLIIPPYLLLIPFLIVVLIFLIMKYVNQTNKV